MATTLTANRILYGDVSTTDITTFAVNPITSLQNAEAAGVANTVPNGLDRRTFLLVENAAGEDIYPAFDPGPGALGAQRGLWWRSSGENPNAVVGVSKVLGGVLADGARKLYGPFDARWASGTLSFEFRKSASGATVGGASVLVAAFYLPKVDDMAGTQTPTPESPLTFPAATASLVQVQGIDINGIAPSFTDHNVSSVGFGLRLHSDGRGTRGNRRVVWVRNNTGQNSIPLIFSHMYADSAGNVYAEYQSSTDEDVRVTGGWYQCNIDNGEECLLGPWDDRVWRLGANSVFGITPPAEYMSLRALSTGSFVAGTTAGLDVAWMDLAA